MPINPSFPYPLYLVISEAQCLHLPWLQVAEEAILGGVDIIQLREKNLPVKDFLTKAQALKKICDKYGIPLVINDVLSVAVDVDAWAVHVGQSDTAPLDIIDLYGHRFKIGWSFETLTQMQGANFDVVDHLGVSPIFKTATKTDTINEWGIAGMQQLATTISKPLIAIGGLHQGNVEDVWKSGANSIAVVSAICHSKDPRNAAANLKALLQCVK